MDKKEKIEKIKELIADGTKIQNEGEKDAENNGALGDGFKNQDDTIKASGWINRVELVLKKINIESVNKDVYDKFKENAVSVESGNSDLVGEIGILTGVLTYLENDGDTGFDLSGMKIK